MQLHNTKPFLILSIIFLIVFAVMVLDTAIFFVGAQLLTNLDDDTDNAGFENSYVDTYNENMMDGRQYGNRFLIVIISLPVIYGFVPFAVFHTIYIVKSKQNKKIKAANEPAF